MRDKILSTYTGILIALNVLAFFVFFILIGYSPTTISLVALQPAAALAGKNLWTFLTSMFMHGSFTHLLVNMISLMFIGGFVEKLIGKKRFLWLYLSGGLFAGLLFVIVSMLTKSDLNVYAVGASGAIFCLGGLLAVLTPRLPVLVFFIIPMPMWMAMIGMLVIIWLASAAIGLPIGNVAHLGGLLVGLGYGFYLKKKYPRKTKMISRYFSR
jgi:uncharacterized protein